MQIIQERQTQVDSAKGSITVEAVLVLTVVIICTALIVVGLTILYHQALLMQTACITAEQAAGVWLDSRRDLETGRLDNSMRKDGLYSRLLADSFMEGEKSWCISYPGDFSDIPKDENNPVLQEKKVGIINNGICKRLLKNIIKPIKTDVTISYSNQVLSRRITVYLEQELDLPFSQFLLDETNMLISAQGCAVIEQPAEYIRNIDFFLEYLAKSNKDKENASDFDFAGLKAIISKFAIQGL